MHYVRYFNESCHWKFNEYLKHEGDFFSFFLSLLLNNQQQFNNRDLIRRKKNHLTKKKKNKNMNTTVLSHLINFIRKLFFYTCESWMLHQNEINLFWSRDPTLFHSAMKEFFFVFLFHFGDMNVQFIFVRKLCKVVALKKKRFFLYYFSNFLEQWMVCDKI